MFRRILVPVDGSRFAEQALPQALRIAAVAGAELELALVHVSYTPATADPSLREGIVEWESAHRQRESDYLHALAASLRAQVDRDVYAALLDGNVVAELVRQCHEREVDMVVMTTHGRAGFERAWLGSVADALLRHIEPPLLLIRPDGDAPVETEEPQAFRHILVALDGTDRAERCVAPAVQLARADHARVTVLRVVSPPLAVASPFLPHALRLTRAEIDARRDVAHAYVKARTASLIADGVSATGDTVVDYHPARALLQYIDAHGIDLVVLGAHGRGALSRMLLGSVSDKVIRAATVPVLIC